MHFKPVKIKVAGTSANLGPAFDCIGIALNIHNEFFFSAFDSDIFDIQLNIKGYGEKNLPKDGGNIVISAFKKVSDILGLDIQTGVKVDILNNIPLIGGLGSSATAIVAVCAFGLYLKSGNIKINKNELYRLAAKIEGHGDNAAPAVFGGLCIVHNDFYKYIKINESIEFVAVYADFYMSTQDMRSVLPEEIKMQDAIDNISSSSLLTYLLSKIGKITNSELFYATRDALHQPYRLPQKQEIQNMIFSLRESGFAAFLSGSGSCIGVLLSKDEHIDLNIAKIYEICQMHNFQYKALDIYNNSFQIQNI